MPALQNVEKLSRIDLAPAQGEAFKVIPCCIFCAVFLRLISDSGNTLNWSTPEQHWHLCLHFKVHVRRGFQAIEESIVPVQQGKGWVKRFPNSFFKSQPGHFSCSRRSNLQETPAKIHWIVCPKIAGKIVGTCIFGSVFCTLYPVSSAWWSASLLRGVKEFKLNSSLQFFERLYYNGTVGIKERMRYNH